VHVRRGTGIQLAPRDGYDKHKELDVVLIGELFHLLQQLEGNSHALLDFRVLLVERAKVSLGTKCFQNVFLEESGS
jgi:ACT domain-containing protein